MKARTARDLGLLVRDHRHRLGLTQAALAERAGVSRQWIVAIEGGQPTVELSLVLRALAALDLELDVRPVGTGAYAPADSGAVVATAIGAGVLDHLIAGAHGGPDPDA